MQEEARREIERVKGFVPQLKMVNQQGADILKLINSYFEDAQHFLKQGKFLQAFEAAIICWAYADAGLHLKVFQVPEGLKSLFTI